MGLSNAERQRRYIARLKARAARGGRDSALHEQIATLKKDLARAKARIADLEKANKAKR